MALSLKNLQDYLSREVTMHGSFVEEGKRYPLVTHYDHKTFEIQERTLLSPFHLKEER